MGTPASLLDLIAHGGSLRAGLDNSQLAAETAHTQAATQLTGAQVPLVQQQSEEARLRNVLSQRQLRDEEIQRGVFADWARASMQPAQPAAPDAAASAPVPGMVGVTAGDVSPKIATPAFNPNAGAANSPQLPNYLSNPHALAMEMAKRDASAPAVMAALTSGIKINSDLAKLTKEQLENETANHGIVADSLQGYLNNPNPQAYAQFYSDAIQREPNLKNELPPPGGAPTQNDLAHVIGKVGLFGKLLANAKTKQETATSAAQAGADTAKANAENQATELAKFKFNLMRSATPETIASSVDGMSVFAGHPKEAQDAKDAAAAQLKATGDPEKAVQAVNEVANGLRSVRTAQSMIPVDVEKATKVATATAPIEVGKAVATAKALVPVEIQKAVDTQLAIAKNSPEAFGAVVDPHARAQAQNNYEKDSKEYADKASEARKLVSLVDAAQSGNKAAAPVIGIEELRGFVNRINSTELKAVGSNAGSLKDQIEGWVKGKTEGQPVPPEILKATKELAGMQEKAARSNYENKVAITNKTYGSKVTPIDLPEPAGKMIRARDPQGNLHEAPVGTALPDGWKAE